jgi:hypothetical protein
VKPGPLLWLALATLGLGLSIARAGSAAIFTRQTQNTGNTFTAASCFAGDTGLLSPSAQAADTGGNGDGFETDPTYAFADDSLYAVNANGAGDRHRYYNYSISIPPGCSIKGIEVRLDWWLDSTNGANSMSIELSWNGGDLWTAAEADSTETTSEHTATLGSSTDTWGRSWTAGELADDYFRVRVASNSDDGLRDFYLDWVPVRVYYGSGGGGGGGASAPAVIIPRPPATSTPTPVVTPTPVETPANTQTPTPIATPAPYPPGYMTPTPSPYPYAVPTPIATPAPYPPGYVSPTPSPYPFAVPTPIATPAPYPPGYVSPTPSPYPFAVPTPTATPPPATPPTPP